MYIYMYNYTSLSIKWQVIDASNNEIHINFTHDVHIEPAMIDLVAHIDSTHIMYRVVHSVVLTALHCGYPTSAFQQ